MHRLGTAFRQRAHWNAQSLPTGMAAFAGRRGQFSIQVAGNPLKRFIGHQRRCFSGFFENLIKMK